jgi:hypothetical protein
VGALDELRRIEAVAEDPEQAVGELAFYGRCSTEDNQDPETSRGWQRNNACKFVEPSTVPWLGHRKVATSSSRTSMNT